MNTARAPIIRASTSNQGSGFRNLRARLAFAILATSCRYSRPGDMPGSRMASPDLQRSRPAHQVKRVSRLPERINQVLAQFCQGMISKKYFMLAPVSSLIEPIGVTGSCQQILVEITAVPGKTKLAIKATGCSAPHRIFSSGWWQP
jgi:hypothetical protein